MKIVWLGGWGVGERFLESHLNEQLPQFEHHCLLYRSTLSYELFIEDLGRQITQPCLLCGWSFGGLLALELAERFPEKILKVIALTSSPRFLAGLVSELGFGISKEAFDKLEKQLLENFEQGLLRFRQMASLHCPERRLLMRQLSSDGCSSDRSLQNEWQLLRVLNHCDILSRLTIPVIYILGGKDPLLPSAESHSLAALAPVIVVPESGHFPFWKPCEEFMYAFSAQSTL